MRREEWDRRYAEADLLWSAEPNRVLVAELQDLPSGRALDLACGEGRNALWLAEIGWRVTGVDFSPVAIDKARRRATQAEAETDVEFVCADLLDYQPEEDAFDLVLILYLQVPPDDRRVVLGRAAAALAPGGTFLLVGHDLQNLSDGVGGPSDASVLYSPDDIASELPGVKVEKAERVLRDVVGADRPAIDALVRARMPG